jgi:hypothetical protein
VVHRSLLRQHVGLRSVGRRVLERLSVRGSSSRIGHRRRRMDERVQLHPKASRHRHSLQGSGLVHGTQAEARRHRPADRRRGKRERGEERSDQYCRRCAIDRTQTVVSPRIRRTDEPDGQNLKHEDVWNEDQVTEKASARVT